MVRYINTLPMIDGLSRLEGLSLVPDVPGPYLSLIDDLARIQEQKRVYACCINGIHFF